MIVNVPGASALLTVNGSVDGLLTVADATPFWVGAIVNVYSATEESVQCVITSMPSNVTMTVRKTSTVPYNYGNSDMSAFHIADTATIAMAPQTLAGNDETYLKHVSFWSGLV